jgi:hypothetical protein
MIEIEKKKKKKKNDKYPKLTLFKIWNTFFKSNKRLGVRGSLAVT